MLLNCGAREDSSEYWCWSWGSTTLATWCEEPAYWKRLWCWERFRVRGEGETEGETVGWHHWLSGYAWVLSPFSRVWLCDPMDCGPPGSSIHSILQARKLQGVAISFSRRASQPRHQTCVSYISCIDRLVLYHYHHQGSPRVWANSGR